ncbi:FG-GAP repeat domain-containing protein [Streptomyces lincolnensis]|uniref:FG-GAP repeat domain-containing protein n=1 Tax=Streptomyces lincolnensis TaxID=1915 RepID=UPI0026A5CDC0|nr:VCBS repeat-containing protein [Streptomyces lincolnensis]
MPLVSPLRLPQRTVTAPESGSYGSVEYNRNTPSVESVALGDFDRQGVPDPAVVTTRLDGLSGGQVYADPLIGNELQQGNGLIAAVGDINGDGYHDLVAGDPDEPDADGTDGALGGRVLIWHGSRNGVLTDAKPVQITQNTAGVPGASEKGDDFGAAPAVTDLNRDGLADIVVGSPYEDLAKADAGQVTVVPGRRSGALGTGATVSAGDVNKDGRPELFVGAAGENNYTGAVGDLPPDRHGQPPVHGRLGRAHAGRQHAHRRQRPPLDRPTDRAASAQEATGRRPLSVAVRDRPPVFPRVFLM